MDTTNRAKWCCSGVLCGKEYRSAKRIPHSFDLRIWLYTFEDISYVIKNTKARVLTWPVITIAEVVISAQELVTIDVSISPVQKPPAFQEDKDLKMASTLSPAVLKPSPFGKIKITSALNLQVTQ